ncbi:SsrA-binding protein SmpB [Candidatus Blochmannia ocreatus (nom. nud.)]|uniref:SsrA-binding protein n=1 Tax=Candidatus Blochmannia ocreatus (nom. nud.) TaxID=251538 RepID=A0ABY4SUK3_9ENTR|nr:SsrA-binding protein SmpB [Candidatus Blochmannia ocreatus]URJ25027.1 SsrA-binding protein SmpB [Candidatus Blochmannia ocreatus]
MNRLILKKITQNTRIYHKYFIEKKIESGIALLGWEVKSARFNRVAIDNCYVSVCNAEAYVYNAVFQSNKIQYDNGIYNTIRVRKLLLKKHEILFLMEKVAQQGYTVVVLDLYWKNSWIKLTIGIAKGKKQHDKRNAIIMQDWNREKMRIMKYKYVK